MNLSRPESTFKALVCFGRCAGFIGLAVVTCVGLLPIDSALAMNQTAGDGASSTATASMQGEKPVIPAINSEDLVRLQSGEILLSRLPKIDGGGAARVQALFSTNVEHLWSVLGSCEANRSFIRGLKRCEVTDESRETAVTSQSVKPHWYVPRLDYRFSTLRKPFEWIRIELIDGDLREFSGVWVFDTAMHEGGVLVTHQISLRPDGPAPGWLVRRTLNSDLGDMFACLRWVSNASPTIAVVKSDRQRCPRGAQQVSQSAPD